MMENLSSWPQWRYWSVLYGVVQRRAGTVPYLVLRTRSGTVPNGYLCTVRYSIYYSGLFLQAESRTAFQNRTAGLSRPALSVLPLQPSCSPGRHGQYVPNSVQTVRFGTVYDSVRQRTVGQCTSAYGSGTVWTLYSSRRDTVQRWYTYILDLAV